MSQAQIHIYHQQMLKSALSSVCETMLEAQHYGASVDELAEFAEVEQRLQRLVARWAGSGGPRDLMSYRDQTIARLERDEERNAEIASRDRGAA